MERFSFSSKHVLVTGATGSTASALCRKLAAKGAVIIGSPRLNQPDSGLSGGMETVYEAADILTKGGAENLFKRFGYIDLLLNIAEEESLSCTDGDSPGNAPYHFKIDISSGPFKIILDHMIKRGRGRIINLLPLRSNSMGAGEEPLTEELCQELFFYNISVLNIYSDMLDRSLLSSASSGENEKEEKRYFDLEEKAEKIAGAAAGPPGEIWIGEGGWRGITAMIWSGGAFPYYKKRYRKPQEPKGLFNSPLKRRWGLFQVEASMGCNLKCIMCPWTGYRKELKSGGNMEERVWKAISLNLHRVRAVDFTGAGEPLLQPLLICWMKQAKTAGCETGFLTNGMLLSRGMAARILETGPDWIGFSLDGATKSVYERIRPGADFIKVCENIKNFINRKRGALPFTMINFVIMENNLAQLEDIIVLAAELGVDQVNFKQCDVIRGDYGKNLGLFSRIETPEVLKFKKALKRAKRRGEKMKVKVRAFSFTPDQLPVCPQDPRASLFIRHDGSVSPCINLAIGGPSQFLGRGVVIPSVHYGRLPEKELESLWESETARFYRNSFQKRVDIYDYQLAKSDFGEASLMKLKKALNDAVSAMPEAPYGCSICHYLHDI